MTDIYPTVRLSDTALLVAIASGKGGTGKSTLSLALGHILAAEHAQPVTLLDLDPQASLSDFAGTGPTPEPLSAPPVEGHGVRVYRGGRALAHAPESAISAYLDRAAEAGGILLADMAPGWSDTAHRAVLSAADLLLLAAKLDAGGLPAIRELVEIADTNGIPYRIIPTFAKRWVLAREVEETLRSLYGDRVTETVIPEDVKAAEAVAAGMPVTAYTPTSRAAAAVRALAHELWSEGVIIA